jgi:hypothetical protein
MSDESEFRKLTDSETSDLRIVLQKELPSLVDDAEDIADLLDYTFAMISNSKSVPYMEGELKELCNEEAAKRIGELLLEYFTKLDGGKDEEERTRLKSIKASGDAAGNALTMSGALGAPRIGGKGNKPIPPMVKPAPTGESKSRAQDNKGRGGRRENDRGGRGGNDDRRGRENERGGGRGGNDRGQGGRGGGRTAAALERLTDLDTRERRQDGRGNPGRGDPGRGGARDHGRGDDRRDARGGRGGRGGRGQDERRARGGGREDVAGRRRDESGRGRISGQRRPRDNMEEEDYIQAPPGPDRGGRGGRGGRFNDGGRFNEGRGGQAGDGAGRFEGPGRGGRFGNRDAGRGGRIGRGGPPDTKRPRREDEGGDWHEGQDQGGWQEGGYDESYGGGYAGYEDGHGARDYGGYDDGYGGYDDGYGAGYGGGYGGYDNSAWYGGRGRGRSGRFGRGRGDGRFGRGGGRFGRGGDGTEIAAEAAGPNRVAEGATEGAVESQNGANGADGVENGAAGHPSPMVAAAFGGRGYVGRGYGARGYGGRFAARGGRGGYRAQVHTMIASKAWVRPKPTEGGSSEGGGDPAPEG